MYKLYARPGAGNVCVEALLAECGVECEMITLDRDAQGHLPESFAGHEPDEAGADAGVARWRR